MLSRVTLRTGVFLSEHIPSQEVRTHLAFTAWTHRMPPLSMGILPTKFHADGSPTYSHQNFFTLLKTEDPKEFLCELYLLTFTMLDIELKKI